jgi:hypothetical protein
MEFYEKYLKYKVKYLSLKNLKQNGGGKKLLGGGWEDATAFGKSCNDSSLGEKAKFPRDVDLSKDWKVNEYSISTKDILTFKNLKKESIEDNLTFDVIRKIYDEDAEKPVLFAMAGISKNSFCGTTEILAANEEKLRGKFKEVYMVNLNSLKNYQDDACQTYRNPRFDEIKKESEATGNPIKSMLRKDLSRSQLLDVYDGEIKLSQEIAKLIHKLIVENLALKKVHLLGKCAGGAICIDLVNESDIYEALYLAVPGSPIHILPLYKLSKERLEKMHFIFGWNANDDYEFNFNGKSSTEKEIYDEEMGKLEAAKNVGINYESYMFRPGNGHQPNPKLFDKIGKSVQN